MGLIFKGKCLASHRFVYPVLAEAESSAYFEARSPERSNGRLGSLLKY